MGLLAGIFSAKLPTAERLSILSGMAAAQKHRDDSTPVFCSHGKASCGMANRYAVSESGTVQYEGYIAAVDGIVLRGEGRDIAPDRMISSVIDSYKKHGKDFIQHLEGEFACMLFDGSTEELMLVRDLVGHKPLYFGEKDGTYYIASEMKGIFAGGVDRDIDLVSLSDFLTLNCVPNPQTLFKHVHQVRPGEMVIIGKNGIIRRQYWSPLKSVQGIDREEEAVERFEKLLREAVRKRMTGDNPFCFLSGGVDSSAVLSFASEISGKPVNAVTVSFDDASVDELKDAQAMARHVGAMHHHVKAEPSDFLAMLETLVFHHDGPLTDTSAYPTYFAGKLARSLTDTILTGDGPDQVLGGSSHHIFALTSSLACSRSGMYRNINGMLSRLLSGVHPRPSSTAVDKIERRCYRNAIGPVKSLYHVRSFCPDKVKRFIAGDALWEAHRSNDPYRHPMAWFAEACDLDEINRHLYADMKFYVPDDLMVKLDRMCMAHGLETLSPFQDKALLDFSLSLPGNMKIRKTGGTCTTKYILRKVCEKRFPPELLAKKKQGFGIPLESWLRRDGGRAVKEILCGRDLRISRFFKRTSIERLTLDFLEGKSDYGYANPHLIVGLVTLEIYLRNEYGSN